MAVMKTPGVYVVEKNAFPNSVVEVATAVPAFIGYTEKAEKENKPLLNKPTRISSMAEFRTYFGGAPTPKFDLSQKEDKKEAAGNIISVNESKYVVNRIDKFTFYYNMLLFFSNGGGACYIVSVGDYSGEIDKTKLLNGIKPLEKEQEPTMLVIPELVNLEDADECSAVQQEMLKHCGYVMQNRFAIFDLFDGYKEDKTVIKNFREGIGNNFLNFGAAYYPWLQTTIVSESELGYNNIKDISAFADLLKKDIKKYLPESKIADVEGFIDVLSDVKTVTPPPNSEKQEEEEKAPGAEIVSESTPATEKEKAIAHKALFQMSALYKETIKEMAVMLNKLPASAAMAGIYTMVDNTKGVWRAPANVSIAAVASPTVGICHEEQEDLNAPINGKAVNAIRYFMGEGIKVWGARTLDGNSLDWRYINVRRTMIMLEESVKNAAKAYVFDPNESNTWVNMKSMIGNFLNGIWKRGGLAGATPDEAYSVFVGLGETMTPEDILEGILRVTVLVAITRPAEFIEITFQQQMQKS